jgi:hypothetical protein
MDFLKDLGRGFKTSSMYDDPTLATQTQAQAQQQPLNPKLRASEQDCNLLVYGF